MFNILNHIHKLPIISEQNTQYTLRCPVCLGKIIVKKSNGAYSCVGAKCSTLEIRKAFDLPTYKQSQDTFSYVRPDKISIPKPIVLHQVVDYKSPTNVSTYVDRSGVNTVRTEYVYDDEHITVRLDREGHDKAFYSTYQGRMISDPNVCLFNENLITDCSKVVLFVEGEKTAIEVCKHGYLALTTPAFCWSDVRLKAQLSDLFFSTRGIVVVPDNDETGLDKAIKVQLAAWSCGIACNILNLKKYYEQEGDDLYDLLERGFDINNLEVLLNER